MNHTVGSGRPSRNSQGIHDHTLQPTPMSTTLVPETPGLTIHPCQNNPTESFMAVLHVVQYL